MYLEEKVLEEVAIAYGVLSSGTISIRPMHGSRAVFACEVLLSQLNQGFESWWGIFRLCIQFWISLFYELPFLWQFYEKDLIRLCFTNLFQVGIILKHMFGIFLIFSYATLQKLYIGCTKFYRETAFLCWSLIDVNPTAFNAVWDVSRTCICTLWIRQFRMEIVKSVLRWIKQ